jgi:uncharacterized protein YqkB
MIGVEKPMNLQLNSLTKERLQESLGDNPGYFKLFYDVEDCGCNGVLVLQIVSQPWNTDIHIQADPFTFLVDARQESLFDASMRLEADERYPSYRLVSDASIISSNIKLKDVRGKQ